MRSTIDSDGEDEAGSLWAEGISLEWQAELSDSRQDIYTLEDGARIQIKF